MSENNGCDIEQDTYPAQKRSWLFSIGKVFAKKRKKGKVSKGNVFPTLLMYFNFPPLQVQLLKVWKL